MNFYLFTFTTSCIEFPITLIINPLPSFIIFIQEKHTHTQKKKTNTLGLENFLQLGMAIRAWPAGPARRPAKKTRGGPGY